MRFLTFSPISAALASASTTSAAVDMNQIIKMSAQVVAGSGTATGSLQLQVSNDQVPVDYQFSKAVFTNWSNLGSPVTVSAAGATLIAQQDMCYRALRAVYTDTFANISTITAVADVADSLNSSYFLASSVTANYYFWFSSGTGVDPLIAGRTAIPVVYTTNDTAATIGGLIRAAAAAKGWTVSGASAQAILTNSATGPTLPASDGAAPHATGFTIANTQPTSNITVKLMCLGM